MRIDITRITAITALWAGCTGAALAHPGHDGDTVGSALSHALSGDHLLALIVVGAVLIAGAWGGTRMRRGQVSRRSAPARPR